MRTKITLALLLVTLVAATLVPSVNWNSRKTAVNWNSRKIAVNWNSRYVAGGLHG